MSNEDYSDYGERISFFVSVFVLVVITLIMGLLVTFFIYIHKKETAQETAHFNNYRQILEIATEDCNSEIVRYLVREAVNIHDIRDLGVILLQHAAKERCLEVVQFLAEKKVDIDATCDKSGNTALHYAAEHGNLEIVKFLLQKGANPNAKEFREKKPRDLARDQVTAMLLNNENSNKPYIEIIYLLDKAEQQHKSEQ